MLIVGKGREDAEQCLEEDREEGNRRHGFGEGGAMDVGPRIHHPTSNLCSTTSQYSFISPARLDGPVCCPDRDPLEFMTRPDPYGIDGH